LEEAEEKMNRRRNSAFGYERWLMKAATNGAAAFSSDVKRLDDVNGGVTNGVHPKKEDMNGNGDQSVKGEDDEEWEAERRNRLGLTTKGDEDGEESGKDRDFDLDDEIEKGIHVKYCFLLILRFLRFCLHLYSISTCLIVILQNYSQFQNRNKKDHIPFSTP